MGGRYTEFRRHGKALSAGARVDGERIGRAAVKATASRRPAAGPDGLAVGSRRPVPWWGGPGPLRGLCPGPGRFAESGSRVIARLSARFARDRPPAIGAHAPV